MRSGKAARSTLVALCVSFGSLAVTPAAQAVCPATTFTPPVAAFTPAPSSAEVGQLVQFDGSASSGAVGQVWMAIDASNPLSLCYPIPSPYALSEWRWDFGDGTPTVTESDPVTAHTFTSA